MSFLLSLKFIYYTILISFASQCASEKVYNFSLFSCIAYTLYSVRFPDVYIILLSFTSMKAKKLLLNSLPLFVLWGAMAAYAAAPSGGYLPNATLDPDCAPWDTDCFVQLAPDLWSAWDNTDGSVADETGSINYTEGNVGIGTTTPQYDLEVYNGVVQTYAFRGKRYNSYTTLWHGHWILWAVSPTDNHLWSTGFVNTTTDPDNPEGYYFISLDEANNEQNNTSDRHLVVRHTGKVGIGTTIPEVGLDIGWSTSSDNRIWVRSWIAWWLPASAWTGIKIEYSNPADAWRIQAYDYAAWVGKDLSIQSSGGDTLLNVGSGNVGIGTTVPNHKLHVFGAASDIMIESNNPFLKLKDANGGMNVGVLMQDNTWATVALISPSIGEGNTSAGWLNLSTGNIGPSDSIRFRPDNVEAMRITDTGNVGIGTTTPWDKLDVAWGGIKIDYGESLHSGNATSVFSFAWQIATTDIPIYGINWAWNTDTTPSANISGFWGVNFFSNSQHRMIVARNGNVGIWTTAPTQKLSIVGGSMRMSHSDSVTGAYVFGEASEDWLSALLTSDGWARLSVQSSLASRAALYLSKNSNILGDGTGLLSAFSVDWTIVWSISTDGTSTSYNTTSDKRLKENFRSLTNAIDTVNDIEVSNYNFIGSDVSMDGFIAQQLDEVLPYAVTGTETDVDENGGMMPMTVDYSKVVPVLTAAIQELSDENKVLKKENEEMKKDMEYIKWRIQ